MKAVSPKKALIVILAIASLAALLISSRIGRPDRCAVLADRAAVRLATEGLRGSYAGNRIGGRGPDELRGGQVTRDDFGTNSPLSSTNVEFRDPDTGVVLMVARIFPDCEIEWRPTAAPSRR